MSAKVVIVNGTAGSGKTTFEQYCQEWWGSNNCVIVSTIDFVKHLAKECGWDGKKTPEARKFLSDFKDFLSDTYMGDITYNDVVRKIKFEESHYHQYDMPSEKLLVFVDAREPKQIQKFKDNLKAITVVVRNENAEAVETSNHADRDVLEFDYDYTINNSGTLDELKEKARVFCNLIRG